LSDRKTTASAQARALTLFVQLARAADLVSAEITPTLVRAELTPGQLGVLELLAAEGAMNLRQLGLSLFRSPPNMTIVVDNLERAGLVRRERDRRDRRIVLVSITADGRERFAEAFPGFAERLALVFARLSAVEQLSLTRLCAKLRAREADAK
jgi:MarR family 2-MHQ and catechol resistance regulon transcriptional repressor